MGTSARDTRWLAFALLCLGLVMSTYGGVADWLDYADYDGRGRLWVWSSTLLLWTSVPLVALGAGIVFAMAVGARRNYLPAPTVLFVAAALAAIAFIAALHALSHAWGMTVDEKVRTPPGTRWGDFDYRSAPVKLSFAPWLSLLGLACTLGSAIWLGWISRSVRVRAARDLDRANREQAKLAGDLVPSPDAKVTEPDEVPRV